MTGSRLGKYEILSKLGEGGMGQVWRARDEQLQRIVALKILPPELSRDPARRARFEHEARALAALNHPNIVAVYEFGSNPNDANGQTFLVSELVDGESLRALMDRGPVPTRRTLEIGTQIADAMAAAHAAGIAHRDLKPENIMLTASTGTVKVLDFGLAKVTAPQQQNEGATLTMAAATTPGTVMGTVGYMSPEQVRGVNTDHRSDIFSLGIILYEMLTGHRAFQAESQVETMNAILHADPPELAPGSVSTAIPSALAAITRRCLEKKPEQRFQSAADLAFALRSVSGTTTVASGIHAVLPPQPAHKQRPRWIWPVAAIVAGAALFIGGFYLRDRTLQHDPPSFQRLTFQRGLVTSARFSPDGRSVVYAATWDGEPGHIYLAIPGDPESRDLGLPDNSKLLAVSANSEVAFLHPPFSPGDGSGTLARGSLSGGQMRPWLEGVIAADWSPDGSSLAVLRNFDGKCRLEYPVGKTLVDLALSPYIGIRLSPDGRRIAYALFTDGRAAIGIVDASTGKTQRLGIVSGPLSIFEDAVLAWSPDSSEIWFRSFEANEWGTVYAIDLKGRKRIVHRFPGRVLIFDIAHDGRVLLRTDSEQVGILGKAPGDAAERDLSILDASYLEGISDDGSMLAASVKGDSSGQKGSVYVRKTDGSQPIRVGDGHAYMISPDGKWISGFSSPDGTTRHFGIWPTGSGEDRATNFPGLKLGIVSGWLPGDQQYLVVGTSSGDAQWRCFTADMIHNALRPVCPEGTPESIVRVSPDYKWALAEAPGGGGRFVAYPLAGGAPKPVQNLTPGEQPVGWRSDSHSIYVAERVDKNKTVNVSIVDLDTGKHTPFLQLHPMRPMNDELNFHITPDGRSYAYNYGVRLSDLYVASGLR